MSNPTIIGLFDGPWKFLSNFYYVIGPNCKWTVEHMYQAMKTLDQDERMEILFAKTPGIAKKLGRICTVRPDWDEIKVGVMRKALQIKFENPTLREKLLDTGDAILIEGNNWGDTYWGMCNGVGKNMLGVLLMEVRQEIRNEQNSQEDKQG